MAGKEVLADNPTNDQLKSSATAQPKKKRKKHRWRNRILLTIAFIIVALIGLRTYLWLGYTLALRDVKNRGLPMTADDLRAMSSPLDGKNMVDDLGDVILGAKFNVTGKVDGDIPWYLDFPREELSKHPDAIAAIKKQMASHAGIYDELMREGDWAGGRWYVHYEDGLLTESEHYDAIRFCVKLLAAKCEIAIAEGRSKETIAYLERIKLLADSLKNEPQSLPALYRIAIRALINGLIGRGLNNQIFDAAQIARLRELLTEEETLRDKLLCIAKGERALTLISMNDIPNVMYLVQGQRQQQSSTIMIFDALWKITGIRDLDYSKSLAFYDEYSNLIERDAWDEIETWEDNFNNQLSVLHFFTRIIKPMLGALTTAFMQDDCMNQMTDTALAIEQFRLAKGSYPADLNQLVTAGYLKEIPQDLLNEGKSIGYRVGKNGAVVYSVGLDGIDDGGKAYNSSGSKTDGRKPGSHHYYQKNPEIYRTDLVVSLGNIHAALFPENAAKHEESIIKEWQYYKENDMANESSELP